MKTDVKYGLNIIKSEPGVRADPVEDESRPAGECHSVLIGRRLRKPKGSVSGGVSKGIGSFRENYLLCCYGGPSYS